MSETSKPSLKPVPDSEVLDRPKRRTFTAAYKLNILRELDALTEPGQVGEVLRHEGFYSSHICDWRRLRALGELQALEPKKTGRPKKEHHPLELRLAEAERKAARLEEELSKARLIIVVKCKLSEILGIVASSARGRGAVTAELPRRIPLATMWAC